MRTEQDFSCFCALIRSLKTYSPGARIVCPASPGRASFVHKKKQQQKKQFSFFSFNSFFFFTQSPHISIAKLCSRTSPLISYFFFLFSCLVFFPAKKNMTSFIIFCLKSMYDCMMFFLPSWIIPHFFFLNFNMTCFFFFFIRTGYYYGLPGRNQFLFLLVIVWLSFFFSYYCFVEWRGKF